MWRPLTGAIGRPCRGKLSRQGRTAGTDPYTKLTARPTGKLYTLSLAVAIVNFRALTLLRVGGVYRSATARGPPAVAVGGAAQIPHLGGDLAGRLTRKYAKADR